MKYSEKEIEEILKKYKLTEEEHEKYYQIIKRLWTTEQYPVEKPIAVIIGGQTGAGKSGIISYSKKMFPNNNVVIINSDEIKTFHPYGEEIASKYSELYTIITDQESNTWTSKLFEDVRNEGYNIIFEGTMKNNRIADEAIPILQKLGYFVVVRGLSVSGLESRLSIHERYEEQLKHKGWGRFVVPEHHNQTYEGMPETIDYIEQNEKYDVLEIYARGATPDMPILKYAKHRNKGEEIAIQDKEFISKDTQIGRYNNAKDAVIRGRKEDIQKVIPTAEERFKKIIDAIKERKGNAEEMKSILNLMESYEKIEKSKKKVDDWCIGE